MKKAIAIATMAVFVLLMGLVGGLENDRIDFLLGTVLIGLGTIVFGGLVIVGRKMR